MTLNSTTIQRVDSINRSAKVVCSRFYLLFFLLFFTTTLQSQNPLNQKITLNLDNENIEDALSEIADAGGFNFSYNPNIIAVDQRVAINTSNKPVKVVLEEILGKKMSYKVRGSYVIIQPPKQNKPKQTFKIKGEIKDASTGKKIEDVTIYEVNKLKSTLSSSDGKYDMTVSQKAEFVNVAIAKKNYQDTVIQVSKLQPLPTIITLTPLKSESSNSTNLIDTANLVKFFVPSKMSKNSNNVSLHERRPFQVSFLPFAGTNRLMSGKIANDISFNILAGYAQSVEKFELGGVANIVRKNMNGIQIGGMANYVGGETNGIQIGGFFNANAGKVRGFQVGGFANVVTDTVVGWQVSGFANLAKMTDAFQLSGFTNISWQKAKKLQISGFANYTKDLAGIQIAGLTNIASGKMKGAQISTLNYADDVKGFQIGVVNVADTISSGISIGLISFVKNGLHKFQYARNDAMHNNVSFKTGSYKFYNILTGSIRGFPDENLWSFGYGLGTQKNFKNGMLANLEIIGSSIQEEKSFFKDLNALGKLNINIGYRFGKHFSISAGPVLYTYVSDTFNPDTGDYGYKIANNPFKNELISSDKNLKMWIGWQAGAMF